MPRLSAVSPGAGNQPSTQFTAPRVALAVAFLMQGSLHGAISQLEIGYDLEYNSDSEPLQSQSGTHQDLTNTSLVQSDDETGTYGKATYSGEAQFGYLKSTSHSDFSGDISNGGAANGGPVSKWIDDLTITSTLPLAVNGTSGRIAFTYAFSVGTISSSRTSGVLPSGVGASWDVLVGVDAQGDSRSGGYDNATASRTGDSIQSFATIELDFIWGTVFTYTTSLGAFTGVNVTSGESAIADVTDLELQLTGIAVKADDTMGSFVTIAADDFTISADSGTTYPKVIPEPGMPLLLLCAGAALAFVRRRR